MMMMKAGWYKQKNRPKLKAHYFVGGFGRAPVCGAEAFYSRQYWTEWHGHGNAAPCRSCIRALKTKKRKAIDATLVAVEALNKAVHGNLYFMRKQQNKK